MSSRNRSEARGKPLTGGEFEALISQFGLFESKPEIAVAVSGGADSMALALLAGEWAAAKKGRCTALTVDHGLRPESGAEARQVRRWLRARGMPCRVLTWTGKKPATGVQAAARAARYRLLHDWCCKHGVLHLITAHTRDDQAETFLLRLERQSGPDGLAAMAAVSEGPDLRLLRPLLTVPKARLTATLRARGQAWIEDPSNENPAFARVGVRRLFSGPGKPILSGGRIAAAAQTMGRLRRHFDDAAADWLARFAAVYPGGYIELDAGALRAAPPEIGLRALARCLRCVSGRSFAARGERLARLFGELRRGGLKTAKTLGGCRVVPAGGKILVCGEARAQLLASSELGSDALWDRRFRVAVPGAKGRSLSLGPLGSQGWSQFVRLQPGLRRHPIPYLARLALPALWRRGRVAAVPHLGFRRDSRPPPPVFRVRAWQPPNPLTGAGFWVAKPPSGII